MDHSTPTNVVTRYAPSPTGFQHIGGIRTALFAWLWARKHNGTFILRIEDTDKSREVEGAIEHTVEALQWLSLDYDYGPDKPGPWSHTSCRQSDRLDLYREYAERLVAAGLAYPDPYSAEELESFRQSAQAAGRPFLFRDHRPSEVGEWDGSQPLRFKVPNLQRYEWHDAVRGTLTAGEEALDDFIILKADGFPTYNFAHIIDDHEMGVTHVMRGEEFISSTPKFLSLYDALEIPWPIFVTLPPIMGPDGKKKLSKRDGAKDLMEYRTDGYLPEAMRNFLALIGWNPGGEQELFFTAEELIDAFSLEKIHRSGGAFNEEKLKWMNKHHINNSMPLGSSARLEYVIEALPDDFSGIRELPSERSAEFSHVVLERVHNQAEIRAAATAGEYDWVFKAPEYPPELLKWKNDASHTAALPRLQKVESLLAEDDFSSIETIKAAIWPYAEAVGKGEVLWPLRVALSGKERSPDPMTLAFVLGKAETQARIATACAKIGA